MGSVGRPPPPPPGRPRTEPGATSATVDAVTTPGRGVPMAVRAIGPYEVIAEIARGGMGVVYLCRRAGEAGFERLFAVKEMHPHLATDHDFVTMLLDEARLAARIHHHNVASVVELGKSERGYYLVMPYVEGCSLDQLLARNPTYRPPSLLVPILIGALNGLHAAHALEGDDGRPVGLVHRDVSPHNVLIGIDGDARITDFGVAKAKARITSTQPGMIKGKLCYCAPELLGAGGRVDHRADQFAAGAVLWSALTGRALFRGDTDAETVQRVLHLEVPPPSAIGLAPTAVFDQVILRSLARDPDKRFPSAGAMAEALRAAALAAGMLGAPTRIARWVRDTFADDLAERHRLIRAARPSSSGAVPVLPQFVPDVVHPPQPTPPPILLDEVDPPPATGGDLARFVAVVAAAFGLGVYVTLYARGGW